MFVCNLNLSRKLIFKICNSKNIDVVNINKSHKKNSNEHGFGIKNIQEIVYKYGGSDYIKQESEKYTFTIIFPHD